MSTERSSFGRLALRVVPILLLGLPACGDDTMEPAVGEIQVTTSTSGDTIDSDGYTVTVDGSESQAIGVNAMVTFSDLSGGDHSVELSDVAVNCAVGGDNLRMVTVTVGSTVPTTFDVTCLAPVGPEIPVTSDSFFQQLPAISANRIVWEDTRNGNADVFMFDALTLTETQISTTVSGHFNPDISGGRIVWRDFSTGMAEIFVHDLATGTETNASNDGIDNQFNAAIDGDRIVWREQSETTFQKDLFVFDLGTSSETQITDNSTNEFPPAISGDRIVWHDDRSGNRDIFMFDMLTLTETQITTDPADQTDPDISGSRIVWEDARNGQLDIFMFDLATGTETQITTDLADQENPAISGNRIVWEDRRTGQKDIFMFDLATGTEIRITTSEGSHFAPDISGNRIVWIGILSGNRDVFMAEVLATP